MRRYEIERFYFQPISKELVEADQDGVFRESVRTYELLEGSDDELDKWWLRLEGLNRPNAVLAIDVNTVRTKKQLLQDLFTAAGIYEVGQGFKCDVIVTQDSLVEFIETCRKQRERVERLLDTSLRKDLDDKAARQLGMLLGHVGLSLQKFGTKKEGGSKIYLYRVDSNQLARIQAVAQRRKSESCAAEWNELQRQWFPDEVADIKGGTSDAADSAESVSDGDDLDAVQAELDAKAALYARAPELAPTEPDF